MRLKDVGFNALAAGEAVCKAANEAYRACRQSSPVLGQPTLRMNEARVAETGAPKNEGE